MDVGNRLCGRADFYDSLQRADQLGYRPLESAEPAPELERTSHLISQISCGLTIVSKIDLLTGDLALTAARLPYPDILWTVTLAAFGIGLGKIAQLLFGSYVTLILGGAH